MDETARTIGVADFIAYRRARRIECAVCGEADCAVLLRRESRGGDHRERLRCEATGRRFWRVWLGGYS